jgi:hypothetical protein
MRSDRGRQDEWIELSLTRWLPCGLKVQAQFAPQFSLSYG